jgi:hypothetical protein
LRRDTVAQFWQKLLFINGKRQLDSAPITETGTGVANVDPITDLIINQIYQAQGTNPAAQFASLTPLQITPAQLASATALVNVTFQQPFVDFKLKPGFDFFTTKYNFTSSYDKFLTKTTFGGFGTDTNTAQLTFGGVSYNANIWAQPPFNGSLSWWGTQTPKGDANSSYYAMYPAGTGAQSSYDGVGKFFNKYLATLKHEGKLLDATNLLPFYPVTGYWNDGKDAFTETEFQATFLRSVTVSGFTRGAITSFEPGVPDSGHNVIGLDYTINKTISGLKLSDLKSASFVCDTAGSQCLFYGNQWAAGVDLKASWELDSLSPTPVPAFGSLKISGSAPTGATKLDGRERLRQFLLQ